MPNNFNKVLTSEEVQAIRNKEEAKLYQMDDREPLKAVPENDGDMVNTDRVRVEYFLRPNFGPKNGLFYHPKNDTNYPSRRWVKVQIQSNTGEVSTLTLSNYEMNLLVEQIRNIQKEHNWSENER